MQEDSRAKPGTAFVDLGYRVWMWTTRMCISCTGARTSGSANRSGAKSDVVRRSNRASATSRSITVRTAAFSRANRRPAARVLCVAGYNLRWLLRMLGKNGATFLRQLHLRLCTVAGVSPNRQDAWVLCVFAHSPAQYSVLSALAFDRSGTTTRVSLKPAAAHMPCTVMRV